MTDTVVKALGAEWHAGCFVCVVSPSQGVMDVGFEISKLTVRIGMFGPVPGWAVLSPWRVRGSSMREVRGAEAEGVSGAELDLACSLSFPPLPSKYCVR